MNGYDVFFFLIGVALYYIGSWIGKKFENRKKNKKQAQEMKQ